MSKYFNWFTGVIAAIGSPIVYYLGGFDVMLQAMIFLVAADYVTGVLKAIYKKELSSAIGYKGIIRKVGMFIALAVSFVIQNAFGTEGLRDVVVTVLSANEAISILENLAAIDVPYVSKLKTILIQLRGDKDDSGTKEKTDN